MSALILQESVLTSLQITQIPALSQRCHLFGYRKSNDLEDVASKNQRYENSFFPNKVSLWNDLGPELRGSKSLAIFKRNLC